MARTKVAKALGLMVRQRRNDSESGTQKNNMLVALLAGENHWFLGGFVGASHETTSTIMKNKCKDKNFRERKIKDNKVIMFS